MNDDALRGIYGVCPEVRHISGKGPLHFFGRGLLVVPRSKGRTWRSFHNLYHHMSSVIIDQVSFRIFSVRIRPFAIWVVFVLTVLERSDFPSADQLLLHSIRKRTRRRRLTVNNAWHDARQYEKTGKSQCLSARIHCGSFQSDPFIRLTRRRRVIQHFENDVRIMNLQQSAGFAPWSG